MTRGGVIVLRKSEEGMLKSDLQTFAQLYENVLSVFSPTPSFESRTDVHIYYE
jgi:hypothetical protein